MTTISICMCSPLRPPLPARLVVLKKRRSFRSKASLHSVDLFLVCLGQHAAVTATMGASGYLNFFPAYLAFTISITGISDTSPFSVVARMQMT
jgi:hypothetical protein